MLVSYSLRIVLHPNSFPSWFRHQSLQP